MDFQQKIYQNALILIITLHGETQACRPTVVEHNVINRVDLKHCQLWTYVGCAQISPSSK
jgi:hypothetical protein